MLIAEHLIKIGLIYHADRYDGIRIFTIVWLCPYLDDLKQAKKKTF